LYNSKDLVKINNLIVYFNIKDVNDLNSFSILNYIYFFKYYFSVIPFFSNYSYKFNLNIDYYSFFIQYTFKNYKIYYPLYFFLNDIYYAINRSFLKVYKNMNFIEYVVNDMNFFVEKKNSLGFFHLKHKIHFKFCFLNLREFNSDNLFLLFKFKI